MKYEITPADSAIIVQHERYDSIIGWLRRQNEFKFTIGDILIKEWNKNGSNTEPNWVVETISHVSTAPKKYIYIHENDVGVGYIKPLLKDGSMGKEMISMTQFSSGSVRFSLDPDYADHLLLGTEGEAFNATTAYERKKKFRERAYRANKKLCVPSLDEPMERIKYIETLKVGDTMWVGHSMDDAIATQVEIVAVEVPGTNDIDYNAVKAWSELMQTNLALATMPIKRVKMKCIAHTTNSSSVNREWVMYFYNIFQFISTKPLSPMTEDAI